MSIPGDVAARLVGYYGSDRSVATLVVDARRSLRGGGTFELERVTGRILTKQSEAPFTLERRRLRVWQPDERGLFTIVPELAVQLSDCRAYMPSQLGLPICFGVHSEGLGWYSLYLEAVPALESDVSTEREIHAVTRLFGHFSGIFVARRPPLVDRAPTLTQVKADRFEESLGVLRLHGVISPPASQCLLEILRRCPEYIRSSFDLQTTFCHNNLSRWTVGRRPRDSVYILSHWGYGSRGPVGADLAAWIGDAALFGTLQAASLDLLERETVAAYKAGLQDHQVQPANRDLWTGYASGILWWLSRRARELASRLRPGRPGVWPHFEIPLTTVADRFSDVAERQAGVVLRAFH